jgi:hypothetical protein
VGGSGTTYGYTLTQYDSGCVDSAMNVILGGFSEDQGICGIGIARCILIEYINEATKKYGWSKVITEFTGVTTLPSTVAAIKF